MNQTERFYKIDQMISDGQLVTFQQLQDTLEVSRATLHRDLEYMRNRLNAPIIYDRFAGATALTTPSHRSAASMNCPACGSPRTRSTPS